MFSQLPQETKRKHFTKMSASLRQRSPRYPQPPKLPAPRAKYNKKRQLVCKNEDKRSHNRPKQKSDNILQEPSLLANAEIYTLASSPVSPLTLISPDLTTSDHAGIRESNPRTFSNCPLIQHQFLDPYSNDTVKKVLNLWDCLQFSISERRYVMRSLITNESLLIPYFIRLKTLNIISRAYNHCRKIRARVLDCFRSSLYRTVHRDSVIFTILQLRELTISMISLDHKVSTILGRPISLADLSSNNKFNPENFFFNECLFTEEILTTMMLKTEFIRTMNLIQLQTLINIFFDKCISWYTPTDSLYNKSIDYEQKSRNIVSLYFLLGLVADAPFEGNILPALFIAHLISIKKDDIVAFRNELRLLYSDITSPSIYIDETSPVYIGTSLPPFFNLPDYNPDTISSSKNIYTMQGCSFHHRSVRKPTDDDILLTPSETFHAILTNSFIREINEEFLQFSRDLGYSLPLVPVEFKENLIEIYKIVHSRYSNDTLNKDQGESLIGLPVPSPFGVESIWVNKPNYQEFSISNACDRSIEGVTGLNSLQLLGEENYDLLGILNWPRITVTPFLVEGASKLMKRLIINNIERRSKSMPARNSKHAKVQKISIPYHIKEILDQQDEQPPPPPLMVTEDRPSGSSKSVPSRPKFIRKANLSNTLKNSSNLYTQSISKPELTLEDLEHEPINSTKPFKIENNEQQYTDECDAHGQITDTEIIVSTDLTAIFLGNNSPTDRSLLSSDSTM